MMSFRHITGFVLLLLLLSACNGKRYNVLHSLDSDEAEDTMMNIGLPTIMAGQELCITVHSLNEESAAYFRGSREREGATGIECLYYMVSETGAVKLPLIGEVVVNNMSLQEAEDVIEEKLDRLLKEPSVRIEYVDFHVSVLGEVALPGVFDAPSGRITLFEAISKAGGISQFGKRRDVLILREEGGQLKHIRFDLTRDEVWNTEYYYLRSKDVVMINSNSGRIANSKNLTGFGSILVGLGSVAAIIVTR